MFNLTNPDGVKNGDKPSVKQLGPYSYRLVVHVISNFDKLWCNYPYTMFQKVLERESIDIMPKTSVYSQRCRYRIEIQNIYFQSLLKNRQIIFLLVLIF